MNDLILRRATAYDANILAELEKECFTDPWKPDYFRNLLTNPSVCFFVGEAAGNIIAYGGMIIVMDECEIINVAVASVHRRCGFGRIMVSKMLDFCRELDVASVFLEHRASNTPAAALYESFGFVPYAVRKKYYSSPVEDAILRCLTL